VRHTPHKICDYCIALHYIQVHRNQYQVPTESPCDFVHCNYVPIVYRFPSYNDGRTRKLVFLSPFYPPQSRLKPSSRLQLNNDKTEFTGCGTVGRLHRLPITGSTIGSFTMTPPLKVRDLGVYIDSGLRIVERTVSRCVAVVRQCGRYTNCSVPVAWCTRP